MKIHALIWLSLALSLSSLAPPAVENPLVGAWRLVETTGSDQGEAQKIRLFSPTYTMASVYTDSAFIGSEGGTYTLDGPNASYTIDYHTWDSSMVGQNLELTFRVEGDRLIVNAEIGGRTIQRVWERIDAGDSPLAGHWKIRARMQDGEMRDIHQQGTRQTIKMLSGTRFQWTAMDPGTQQFMGCGGGTYTFEDGVYTEHIEFFSRDNSRIGMGLSFQGKVDGDDWHHSGKSSRGQPISEIWARQGR